MDNSAGLEKGRVGSLVAVAKHNKSGLTTLAASLIGLMLSLPVVFMTTSAVLMVPISESTGWNRSSISAIIAVAFVGNAIGCAVFGRVLASFDARKVIALSTLVLGGSLIGFGVSQSYVFALLFAAGMGLLGAGAGMLGYVAVLPLWFDRRLGLALGIAMLGVGAGQITAPLIVEMLARSFDWREVFVIMGSTVLCIALPGALFLVKLPGSDVQRNERGKKALAEVEDDGMVMSEVFRDRRFWQLGVLFFIATAFIAGTSFHLPSMMSDKGLDPATAALMLTIWGFGLTISRFLGGALLDYVDYRWAGSFFMLAAAIGFLVLMADTSLPMTMVAVFIIASAQGMDGDLLPYIIRRCFGLKAYSTAFGLLTFAFYLGATAGFLILGFTFDLTGSYAPIMLTATGAMVLSTVLLIGIGKPPIRK